LQTAKTKPTTGQSEAISQRTGQPNTAESIQRSHGPWQMAQHWVINHKGYPKVYKGNYDLQLHLSVSGGRGNERENVNYKFRIKVKYAT